MNPEEFYDIMEHKIYFRKDYEDPSSPEFVATVCIVIYLDLVKCFFSATEMAMCHKPFPRMEQRQKRETNVTFVC